MLPPIGSPTSPQDVQMTDLNILTVSSEPQHQKLPSPVDNRPLNSHSPLSLSSVKSTNTLRNNIDVKNELNKKRTSLNLHENGNAEMFNACDTSSTSSSSSSSSSASSSSSMGQQPLKLATVKRCSRNLDNARYRRELQSIANSNGTATNNHSHDNVNNNVNASRLFNQSSSDSDVADSNPQHIDTVAVIVNENGKMHRRIRRKVQDKSQNGNAPQNASNNDDDGGCKNDRNKNDSNDNENNEFDDRRNGNASDRSTQKRDSITSKESGSAGSSDDYFLCEKFKNTLNAKLCDAVVNGAVVLDENGEPNRRLSLELLSPHEGPLGRRYAEIAPSKNNSNSNTSTNNKW